MVFYNAKNKAIGQLDTLHQQHTYGAQTIQVKRARISELLRDQVEKQGISIAYGQRICGLEESENKVIAHFENGYTEEADLLIACDGTQSVCRKILFPKAPKPIYTRQLSTGAIVNINGLASDFGQIKMIFGKQAFFAYAVSNKGEVWWFNNYYREKEPGREEMHNGIQKEVKAYLLQIHRDDPKPIMDIIAATDHMFAYPVYEIPSLPEWHKGKVCLVGDAAHATAPHIGQGASLALEDTIVLARHVSSCHSLPEAFRKFQAERQPRVEKLIKQARKIGDNKSRPNLMATFLRDLFLKHFIQFEIKKLDWVYSYKP
jgi:2-polyprenyl-6-methoxyphenol hydroxylase-like FAD-dependent oxidoreductase